MDEPMIGLPKVIEVNGEEYAKLPEGWPAADDEDLAEAHAEAVVADEPESEMPEWERRVYSWTAAEVKELVEKYFATLAEVNALRKGMKTMQRKQRKQTQVRRRLERRLGQARAARESLREQAEQYKEIARVNTAAAFELSLQQLKSGERVQL